MAGKRAGNAYVESTAAEAVDEAVEESTLEAFALIANIDKAWCRAAPPSPGQPVPSRPAKSVSPGRMALDVMVQMSQRNLAGNRIRKFLSSAHIPEAQGDLSTFHWAPFPIELAGVAAVAPSPSGSRMLVVKNGDAAKGEVKPVQLEIWGAGRLLKEVFVAPSVHRAVYTDGSFESFAWNQDETRVAYIAEEAAPKPRLFGKSKVESSAAAAAAAPAARGRYSSAAKAVPVVEKAPAEESASAGAWKGQGDWQSDWGEQYTGKGRPLLFVLNISEGVVEKVEEIPEDLSVGQVVWAPPTPAPAPGPGPSAAALPREQSSLVFVGWSSTGSNFPTARQLGFKYCSNRPCAIFAVAAPGAAKAGPSLVKLTAPLSSAFSPQFSPDGQTLVFLSAQASVDSGAHLATNSLHSLKWPGDVSPPPPVPAGRGAKSVAVEEGVPVLDVPIQTIIEVALRPEVDAGFPGLYCDGISRQPWLADGKTLLLTTIWRSTQAIIAVNTETGRLSRLTPEGPISWKLLDVLGNAVVAGASTPACPTKLMLGRMNAGFFKQEGWLWSEISTPHVEYADEVESSLKSTEFEVISIPPSATSLADAATEGAKLPFEAIFVRKAPEVPPPVPAAKGAVAPAPPPVPPSPLVVVPHGGPHTTMCTNFVMPYAYLSALGYSVLHVNYRGSLGFGEEALQSLPGKIGRQDVDDVLEAIERLVEMGYADPTRVAVLGGSHGGFLAAHLIGQEPDRFQTAVLRNPVCNLATMVGTSDIRDWCFVEAMGAKGLAAYTETPSAADLEVFLAASPISHASKVKVPTLFLLGGQDRRVPPSNGMQYALALRAQGLEAKIIMFPEDVHSIEKPQSEFESWLAIASWLKTYL